MESYKRTTRDNIVYFLKGMFFKRLISDYYEKKHNPTSAVALTENTQKGWSIIVTTSGKDIETLKKLIDSVKKELDSSAYEIIFVGPANLDLSYPGTPIRFVAFKELDWGIPGWITRKKNLGARAAKYDKIVVTHDYIQLMSGWKKGFDAFGDNFEVASNVFINKDGSRHKDWITYDHPVAGRGSLPYHAEATKFQYLNGAYFVAKRNFFLANPLDEKLRWGEAEDVEWSKRIREITTFRFNKNSAITYSKQKPGDNEKWQEGTKKLEEIYGKNLPFTA